MIALAALEAALRPILPADLHPQIALLAELLAAVAENRIPPDELDRRVSEDTTLAPLLDALRGKRVALGETVLAFAWERGATSVDERQGVFIGEGAVVEGAVIGVNHGTVVLPPSVEVAEPPAPEPVPRRDGFVGRARELATFQERLAADGAAVITGMAGVGKTALAAEIAGRLAAQTPAFWHTFHEDEGADVVIWKLAGFLARDGRDALWRMLDRARQTDGQPPPPDLLIDYLLQLLHGSRFLLCLDDFQFVEDDPLLGRFIERLLGVPPGERPALLLASRHTPAFAQEEEAVLEGLSADDAHALLAARGLALAPELEAALYAQTGGNAQITALAIDRLLRARDPAALIARLAEAENIERYLLDAIDEDLTDDERAVLSAVAALLGYGGSRAAVEAVLGRGGLRRTLSELCERHLLVSVERDAGREYGVHAIVRAFYYDALGEAERRAMHQRAGAFYESAEPDLLRAARHYQRANEQRRAAAILLANAGALTNQGQARTLRQLLGQFTPAQLDAAQWIELRIACGELDLLLGDGQAARAHFDEALDLLASHGDTPMARASAARAQRGLAQAHERAGSYAAAEAACRAGLALTGEAGPLGLEAARLHAQLATVLRHRGKLNEAEAACRAGLAVLPAEPEAPRERIALLQRLATISGSRGNYGDAARAFEQSLAVARTLDDPLLTAAVLHNLGTCLQHTSDNERALACYEESLRLKEEVGNAAGRVVTLNNLASIFWGRGDYERALERFRECRDLCERLGMPKMLAHAIVNIGHASYQGGQLDAAQANLEQALALWEEIGELPNQAQCLFRLGDVALARPDAVAAAGYAERALELAREAGNRAHESAALRVLGSAKLALDQPEAAAEYLEQARALQEQIGEPYDQTLILVALARLAAAQGDRAKAEERQQAALALAQRHNHRYLIALAEGLRAEIETL